MVLEGKIGVLGESTAKGSGQKSSTTGHPMSVSQGKKLGGLWVFRELAKQAGLEKILGKGRQAKIAMLLIIGRILTQGSRLHLLQWAQGQEIEAVLGLKDVKKDELYRTLDWLSEQQAEIEKKLFSSNSKGNEASPKKRVLFLYDVTSSYLEGEKNELGNYGYNRDKKEGKQQIVIGLLMNELGSPVSVSVFEGNTSDTRTVPDQISTLAQRFKVKNVVMVGDRGMIKVPQKSALDAVEFSYITSLTKKQIEVLMREGTLQLGLFDSELAEVSKEAKRYILKRNPVRQNEIRGSRKAKLDALHALATKLTTYLGEHPRSRPNIQLKRLVNKIERYGFQTLCKATATERVLSIEIDPVESDKIALLDGCYVLETNVTSEDLDAKSVHARYKDLALVEFAFRTMKTACLEVRPIFVRKESRTRGHVFVTMLAYLLTKKLWDVVHPTHSLTRPQLIDCLEAIQTVSITINGATIKRIPSPAPSTQAILDSLKITLPLVI